MIRTPLIVLAALSLGGCSTLNSAVQWIDEPQTQEAVVTIKAVATALVCDISTSASIASSIAGQIGKAKISVDGTKVAVVSGQICAKLGGTLTGDLTTAGAAITAVTN